jgi:hypothetical protein
MHPICPPIASWIVIAVALIVAETLVEHQLRWVVPETPMGVVYMATVQVVSNVWRSASRVVVPVFGAAASGFSYIPPSWDFVSSDPQGRRSSGVRERVVVSVEVLFRVARPRGDGERR